MSIISSQMASAMDTETVLNAPTMAETEEGAMDLATKLSEKIEHMYASMQEARKQSKILMRSVQKMQKTKRHKRTNNLNRQPSGFQCPIKVLPKLTLFLNEVRSLNGDPAQAPGEMIARTDVTRYITCYIKANGLQDPNAKRNIILDAKLATLFDCPVGHQISWFQLQTVMAPLFDRSPEALEANATAKAAAKTASASASASAHNGDDSGSAPEPTPDPEPPAHKAPKASSKAPKAPKAPKSVSV